jgi:hypothetical protein
MVPSLTSAKDVALDFKTSPPFSDWIYGSATDVCWIWAALQSRIAWKKAQKSPVNQ